MPDNRDAATPAGGAATVDAPRRKLFSTGVTGTLLRDRNFWPYLLGNLLSNTGTWFQVLGQSILVYRDTHSTVLLGVLGFSQYAAVFILAPVTGRVVDRFDRQKVILATQCTALTVSATLAVIAGTGHASAPLVIVFAGILGISNSFATPSMMAYAPSLVSREVISTALALNSVTFNIGRALGPVLAALVIDTLGPAWAFGVNSCSYVAMIVGVLSVRALTAHTPPTTRPRLSESIDLVRRNPKLAGLLCAILAMNMATDPPITLGPPFMNREFHHAATLSGILIGGFGVGAVVAAFTFAHRLVGTRRTVMIALGTTGLGLTGFAFAPSLPIALAALFVLGMGYLSANTAATSRLQLEVADEHRGRIMVLWSIAFLGARPIASVTDGTLADVLGLRFGAFALALPALGAAAVLFFRGNRKVALA